MLPPIPVDWREALAGETAKPYFAELAQFLAVERAEHAVFPPPEDTFRALELASPKRTRVLILGQDPYHGPGQAHGLSFSVPATVPLPASLVNLFRERESDLGLPMPAHGDLTSWARQGVLLLNSALTVRAHEPASHSGKGWEQFTDAVIQHLNGGRAHVVFLLLGNHAHRKSKWLDEGRHTVLKLVHPSPLSAYRGFVGSRPYSQINAALKAHRQKEIDWSLPAVLEPQLSLALPVSRSD